MQERHITGLLFVNWPFSANGFRFGSFTVVQFVMLKEAWHHFYSAMNVITKWCTSLKSCSKNLKYTRLNKDERKTVATLENCATAVAESDAVNYGLHRLEAQPAADYGLDQVLMTDYKDHEASAGQVAMESWSVIRRAEM